MIFYMTVYFKHSNLEIKIEYADIPFSSIFFIEKGRILSSCPSRFRFRTSPYCLMVVLLPSWGKNKCRALVCVCVWQKWPKVNWTTENWKWTGSPNLKSIPQAVCQEMSGNCLINQRWWELASVACDNKLTLNMRGPSYLGLTMLIS